MSSQPATPAPSRFPVWLFHWLPLLLWMLLIFLLSHQDKEQSKETSEWVLAILGFLGIDPADIKGYNLSFWVRKAAHFTEYFILGILSHRLLERYVPGPKIWLWAWLFCACYAGTDEFHQRFVPGRGASIIDVGIDSLGAIVGILCWRFWQGRKSRTGTNIV
ncbi:MAG: VanZ family protein [Bacteroidota bacterium]